MMMIRGGEEEMGIEIAIVIAMHDYESMKVTKHY
jgi:hypothetical protein